MAKLQPYQSKKLEKITETYLKENSKLSEFEISQIENLDGGDLLTLLNYITTNYFNPKFKEKDNLYKDSLKKIEELEKKIEEQEELKETLQQIKSSWEKIKNSERLIINHKETIKGAMRNLSGLLKDT
jgi:DNA-binding FrmR family transcriptional regulator